MTPEVRDCSRQSSVFRAVAHAAATAALAAALFPRSVSLICAMHETLLVYTYILYERRAGVERIV